MLDPKKILDDLLSAKVPGTDSTVAQKAEQAKQMAKDN
ncbi:MAG: tellurite resistance TerB family protein, partial [Rhizobiaceae bacterium]